MQSQLTPSPANGRGRNDSLVKSPSDTTIYDPALTKLSHKNNNRGINLVVTNPQASPAIPTTNEISNFIEGIRIDVEKEKESESADEDEDQDNCNRPIHPKGKGRMTPTRRQRRRPTT